MSRNWIPGFGWSGIVRMRDLIGSLDIDSSLSRAARGRRPRRAARERRVARPGRRDDRGVERAVEPDGHGVGRRASSLASPATSWRPRAALSASTATMSETDVGLGGCQQS